LLLLGFVGAFRLYSLLIFNGIQVVPVSLVPSTQEWIRIDAEDSFSFFRESTLRRTELISPSTKFQLKAFDICSATTLRTDRLSAPDGNFARKNA
jgi:hypothetical protein